MRDKPDGCASETTVAPGATSSDEAAGAELSRARGSDKDAETAVFKGAETTRSADKKTPADETTSPDKTSPADETASENETSPADAASVKAAARVPDSAEASQTPSPKPEPKKNKKARGGPPRKKRTKQDQKKLEIAAVIAAVLVLLLILILTLTLTTCGDGQNKGDSVGGEVQGGGQGGGNLGVSEHVHDFSDAWSRDGAEHWRECVCGGTTDRAAHAFRKGYCSVCGVHDHVFAESWSADKTEHWRDCVCGEKSQFAAHAFHNGICVVCGYDKTTKGLEYKLNADGTEYSVVGVGTAGRETSLIIPAAYNGLPVTEVAPGAFSMLEFTELSIPDTVRRIGYSAFSGLLISSVEIPESVTEIGYDAFSWCFKLTSFHFPKSVVSIPIWEDSPIFMGVFTSCDSLVEITVDPENPVYYAEGNCLIERSTQKLLDGCMTSVIPDGVKRLGQFAFYECDGLREIVIPDSVTEVDYGVLNDCDNLLKITLGRGMTDTGNNGFLNNRKLLEVCNFASLDNFRGNYEECNIYAPDRGESSRCAETADGYRFYEDNNGAYYLYGYGGTETILTLPDNYRGKPYTLWSLWGAETVTEIRIPAGVTRLGENAFSLLNGLERLTVEPENPVYYDDGNCVLERSTKKVVAACKTSRIPDDATEIANGAFVFVKQLKTLVVGSGVTKMQEESFRGCNLLEKVYYRGTEAQWNAIESIDYWQYDLTMVPRYDYSETEPTEAGNFWRYAADGTTILEW